MKTCRLLATGLVLVILAIALTACATVEDQHCRTAASILDDASYYDVCLQQKAAAAPTRAAR